MPATCFDSAQGAGPVKVLLGVLPGSESFALRFCLAKASALSDSRGRMKGGLSSMSMQSQRPAALLRPAGHHQQLLDSIS